MAKYFKYSFAFLYSCILAFSSCQEGSEAGDLFGQWRMTGSNINYISFSGSVTALRNDVGTQVFGNFQHVGDSLFIQCYSIYGEQTDTLLVEDSFGFRPFNNIRAKIVTLDSDQLVLSKDGQTWSFRKW